MLEAERTDSSAFSQESPAPRRRRTPFLPRFLVYRSRPLRYLRRPQGAEDHSVGERIQLLAVLVLAFVLNQADRQVLAILMPGGLRCGADETPEDDDCLDFTDTQQGLLTGPAFTVVFVLAGLPLSYIADHYNRKLVLLGGLCFWTLCTCLVYFVSEYYQLLLLRFFLGVGEASCNPAAFAMIAHAFPPAQHATALSVYHFGVYLGGGGGLLLAGVLNKALGWRKTSLMFSAPGAIVAVLVLLFVHDVRAPSSQGTSGVVRQASTGASYLRLAVRLFSTPQFVMLVIGSSMRLLGGYALGYWLPTFYHRAHEQDSSEYGLALGLIVLFAGGSGAIAGGLISDSAARGFSGPVKPVLIASSAGLALPFLLGGLLVESSTISYVLIALSFLLAEAWIGPAAAIVQGLVSSEHRAQASAIYLGATTLVGGLGPLLVGVLTTNDGDAIKYSLSGVVGVSYFVCSVIFACIASIPALQTLPTGLGEGADDADALVPLDSAANDEDDMHTDTEVLYPSEAGEAS
eukprot:m.102295 g.102295  ORF g.102295 m.102295 type:complete len:518 (-) comp9002_c0_seq2:55-1608(-)